MRPLSTLAISPAGPHSLHFGWGNVAEPAGEGELGLYFEDRSVSMMQEEKEFLVGASALCFRDVACTDTAASLNWLARP
jgi:hypothetical protein